MRQLTVALQTPYDILIAPGLLPECGPHIRNAVQGDKIMLISDSHVMPLYGGAVRTSLEAAGFAVSEFVFEAGEQSKQFETVMRMVCAMADAGLSRVDTVVALGGGVTGDMAGFAAAVYMRGISYVQLSTSLLSCVDSSVGGKTGCDLPNGKNLAGAFHQPRLVLIDTNALSTLPERYLRDGMAEVIKYGVIRSKLLFDSLADLPPEEIIYRCIDIKRQIVEHDEQEHGERKLLNFGHTLGHAIEKYCNFTTYSHGEAVGLGMLMITQAAEQNGLCDIGLYETIESALMHFGLPTTCEIPVSELVSLCLQDKKRRAETIDLVIASAVGESSVHSLPTADLADFLKGADQWTRC